MKGVGFPNIDIAFEYFQRIPTIVYYIKIFIYWDAIWLIQLSNVSVILSKKTPEAETVFRVDECKSVPKRGQCNSTLGCN